MTEGGGRFECGVCWQVYDPALGDAVAQVPPGTPFAALPEDWCCPGCEAPKARFLALDGDAGAATTGSGEPVAAVTPTPAADPMAARITALLAAYRRAEPTLRGTPVHNPRLGLAALGFRPWEDGAAGVVVTPWFMNLTLLPALPAAWDSLAEGEEVERSLPGGVFPFVAATLEGVGRVLTCSLFSPMEEFVDHKAARLTALAAAAEALDPPAPRATGRRGLFAAGAAG